jgi:hypothetical protein
MGTQENLSKDGLQKLTDKKELKTVNKKLLAQGAEGIWSTVLEGKKFTIDDLIGLTEQTKASIAAILTGGIIALHGEDNDQFIEQVEDVISDTSKRELYERNHYSIMRAMDEIMLERGRLPTDTQIACLTGLSRVTVHKHLKNYKHSEDYKNKMNSMRILREKILSRIYKSAMDGDMRAAKIFMDSTGEDDGQWRVSNNNFTQNNIIQFNEVRFTEDEIKALPENQQQKLIRYLKKTFISSGKH